MCSFIEILRILVSWPVAAVLVIFLFKKDIKEKLQCLDETFFGKLGVKFRFPFEDSLGKMTESAYKDVGNAWNVYWTGHDLMWTSSIILTSRDKNKILHGLDRSLFHLRQMGFESTEDFKTLTEIRGEIERASQDELGKANRFLFIMKIENIKKNIGDLILKRQDTEIFRPS